jgi:hypothetical protein
LEGDGGNLAKLSVGHRERRMQQIVYDAEVPVSVLGNCGLRSSGRYVRLRLTLPAAADFDHISGIETTPRPEGRLR